MHILPCKPPNLSEKYLIYIKTDMLGVEKKKKVELIFFPPLQLSPKPTGGDGKNFTDFRKKLDEAWV